MHHNLSKCPQIFKRFQHRDISWSADKDHRQRICISQNPAMPVQMPIRRMPSAVSGRKFQLRLAEISKAAGNLASSPVVKKCSLGSLGLQFPSQLSNTAKLIQSKNSPVHPSSLHSAHQPWPSLEASWLKPWRSSPAQSVLPGAWRCDHPYLGAWHNGQVSLPHGKRHHKAKVLWVVISFFAMCVRSLGRGTRITRGKMAGWDWTTALLINLCSPSSVNFNQTNELAL